MDFIKEWQAWIIAVVGFVVWLVRLEMRNRFNEQSIIKLNMDSRKQFDVIGKSIEKVENSVFTLGCKIESSVTGLIATVNELKGIVSEIIRNRK